MISLIHLGILVSHKNGNREEEWPNYEFFDAKLDKQMPIIDKEQKEYVKPFKFKMTVLEILRELVYKKKSLPTMNPRQVNVLGNSYKFESSQMQ